MMRVASPLSQRVERFIRRHSLIDPGRRGRPCLVSGGADSTCLWHVLASSATASPRSTSTTASAAPSRLRTPRFCREQLGAEVVEGRGGRTEDELRRLRYSFAPDRLRATGHTASDQVETVLFRLVSERPARRDQAAPRGRRRPAAARRLARGDEAYCEAEGLLYRDDSTNPTRSGG